MSISSQTTCISWASAARRATSGRSGGSSEIPEPSTFLLLGAGLAAAAGMRRLTGA
ncbi:MAG: PEP-CTERM sorting domain-containing protein [Bryobacteraceae bacterium]|nr:PEP-CTERM sorting domain-containing protein [Bryobacteraceae bacterium]